MLLYSKLIAKRMKDEQRRRIAARGRMPKLVAVQVGDNLASATYIKMKQAYGAGIGAEVDHRRCDNDLKKLETLIEKLNADTTVDGIIIQLPLPDPSITEAITARIAPEKDVDGLGPKSQYCSATAMAVIKLLEGYEIDFTGKRVVLVGHGRLVGRPLAKLLADRGVAVTVCDRNTPDLAAITQAADILVSATGVGGIIKPGMAKKGAVVVDVGTGEDAGVLVGDVDPSLLGDPSLRVSPSEGGVGPLTVSTLFEQLIDAAERRANT